MKISIHRFYLILLVLSIVIVLLSFCCPSFWDDIIMSIGCGGVASVMVAWLIDWQNHRNIKEENKKKLDIILCQYVKIYRRLVWSTINECYGLYQDDEARSLREWLAILSDEKRYVNVSTKHSTMQRRCERLSGNLIALQKYIENFQVQSANLILNDFPDIENLLTFFEVQHVHAWGTLKQLEDENYKNFCDTTFIIYKEFMEKFPQYHTEFMEKYSASILREWKL